MTRLGISLDQWYPIVSPFVRTPVTKIIPSKDLTPLLDDEDPDLAKEFEEVVTAIRVAGDEVGWPIFLRTGLTSGKHDWLDTCYVEDKASVSRHVNNLIEVSASVDFMGLPADVWVVREMLEAVPAFHAFNGLPITKERRFYVDTGGEVLGWHPYWPPDAIEQGSPDAKNWQDLLFALNKTSSPDEVGRLEQMTRLVGQKLPDGSGAWSVDWLYVRGRGWFLTDMAWAERSWVWWDWPNAPKKDRIERLVGPSEIDVTAFVPGGLTIVGVKEVVGEASVEVEPEAVGEAPDEVAGGPGGPERAEDAPKAAEVVARRRRAQSAAPKAGARTGTSRRRGARTVGKEKG